MSNPQRLKNDERAMRVKSVSIDIVVAKVKTGCRLFFRQLYRVLGSCALLTLAGSSPCMADYTQHPEAKKFVDEMVAKNGFNRAEVMGWLAKAEKKQAILDAISRPAEQSKTWKEYRPIFLVPTRIESGVKFWRDNKTELTRAERAYGVPAEMIVAIIGVETSYGRITGNYNVLDALTTLAFDYPPRAPFFRSELENYLLLTREQKHSPLEFKGSYAGAMGYGQFMPSSYRKWAVDFSGDGFTDIWKNTTDAIGSVANYFKEHGWRTGEPVTVPAHIAQNSQIIQFNTMVPPEVSVEQWRERGINPVSWLPPTTRVIAIQFDGSNGLEYWFGLQNFYVITRYNRSPMYAMAVYQLSQAIKLEMEKSE
jgi:membrane-bound lytic murein transglycosylase B